MAALSTERHCLTTAEAASYIYMSQSWLRQRRMTGSLEGQRQSPPFVRIGRAVRYRRVDLDRWLASQVESICSGVA